MSARPVIRVMSVPVVVAALSGRGVGDQQYVGFGAASLREA
jgi:hypothetical protein